MDDVLDGMFKAKARSLTYIGGFLSLKLYVCRYATLLSANAL